MRQIYAIGETVYDLIFRDEKLIAAKAGGSMLNSAVSLGRLQLPVHFISEFANDNIGKIIRDFLFENNVSDDFVYRYNDGKTALSLAFLNETSDADFTFYKLFPRKRLNISLPEIQADDIVLFGSFFSLTNEIRPQLMEIIHYAASQGAIIIYDPNFRKAHLHQLNELKEYILENISLSHLVRGSDEDFYNIFACSDIDNAYKEVVKCGCTNLIYTANKKGVFLRTDDIMNHFDVNKIKPLSTIGAGDNFNAGIIFSLYEQNISLSQLGNLESEKWNRIIEKGIDFGTHVCLSYDNYISKDFAGKHLL